ncbi:MAG: porin [Sutterellaceae bacterium]|nr:porin [Sutterellaceae bacterium]
MKKLTLVSAAVAGAFALSASAADVTVYGVIDTGFSYTHNGSKMGDATNSFTLDSGNNLGSRFGFKGEEDLGNGFKAGFVLENGFSNDTGALSDSNRLFGREAVLYVDSDYGKLRFGRMTQLSGSTGSTSIMAGKFSAMSTGWGNVYGHNTVFAGMFSRLDNMIMYSTPKFAGFQAHVQYSSGIDAKSEEGTENTGEVTRYIALGAEYFNGPFSTIAEIEQTRYAETDDDEGYSFNLSFGYDFDVVKVLLAGQYSQDVRKLGKGAIDSRLTGEKGVFNDQVAKDGFGVNLGISAPIAGGKLYADVGYGSYEASKNSSLEMDRWMASVGYEYFLSKRTSVYGGVGYYVDSYDGMAEDRDNAEMFGTSFGLIHRF